jgi:succinate-semialdehyde dehydrogenase / glutarate-semialdehyde dehydrogenase
LKGEEGTYSPLSTRRAALDLEEQVRDATDKGAKLHAGGVVVPGTHAFFAPTVLTDVVPGMRAYHEELFGPVALVHRVNSDEEALKLANDSQLGLGGAVFSQDPERARALADRLEVGMANVNAAALEHESVPFGGVKRSGFGRELGPRGMEEFANKQVFFVAD